MRQFFLIGILTVAACSAQVVVKNHATGAVIATPFVLPDAPVGDSEQIALDVVNTGTASVTVNSALVTGEYFSLCCETAFNLAPSQTVTLTLAFEPLTADYSSGSIQIDALTIFMFARGRRGHFVVHSNGSRTDTGACGHSHDIDTGQWFQRTTGVHVDR